MNVQLWRAGFKDRLRDALAQGVVYGLWIVLERRGTLPHHGPASRLIATCAQRIFRIVVDGYTVAKAISSRSLFTAWLA